MEGKEEDEPDDLDDPGTDDDDYEDGEEFLKMRIVRYWVSSDHDSTLAVCPL